MKAGLRWSHHSPRACALTLMLCTCVQMPFAAAQSANQQPPTQVSPTQASQVQQLPGQSQAGHSVSDPASAELPSALSSSWIDRWKNRLRSDQQRLQLQKDAGEYDELATATGDPQWSAAGRFRQGDFAGAAEDYAQFGDEQALYNGATAMAHAADYDSSLKLFDELLQRNPQHEDALHNRSVVEKLRDMQQQEQQQQNGEGSDEQNSDQQQDPQDSDTPPEQSEQEQSEQDQSEQQDQQQGDPDEQDDQQAQASSSPSEEVDEQQLQQSEEEREALQQAIEEAQRELQQQALREQPMTEAEQATEQWLRQIPDDPSGLLRRKLQRSHSTDYPRIGDSKKPW